MTFNSEQKAYVEGMAAGLERSAELLGKIHATMNLAATALAKSKSVDEAIAKLKEILVLPEVQ